MSKYAERADLLDLPEELYQEILTEVNMMSQISNRSVYQYNDKLLKSKKFSWRELLFLVVSKLLVHDGLKTYRLSDNLKNKIINHYRQFLSITTTPDLVEFRCMPKFIFFPPHIDSEFTKISGEELKKSNQCSVVFGILTNNEKTNWYTYPDKFEFFKMNPFKLVKVKSICLQQKEAYLYDNSSIHSVTNGKFFKPRCLLVFTWHNMSYQQLDLAYNQYKISEQNQ